MSMNVKKEKVVLNYFFFLWRLALALFFLLCVATLCLFLFLPLGIVGELVINIGYLASLLVFTPSTNTLAGLKAGMLCAGILIVVFFEMFLPVFSALVLMMKLPKPLKYTLSPVSNEVFTSSINVSTVA